MNETNEILDELKKPLDPARVAKREGAGGRKLSYLETYDVIDNLNRIFGYDGWSDRVKELAPVNDKLWRATVEIQANLISGMVTHSDTGIGVSRGNSAEELEKCIKEAVSDALKRAARKFGDQFGNCLYDKHAPEHNAGNAQQRPAQAQQPRQAQSAPAGDTGDVPPCSKCGGPVWDNRFNKKNPKQPDFKCKDKDNCGHGVWLDSKNTQHAPAQSAQSAYKGYSIVGKDLDWLIGLEEWMHANAPQHPQRQSVKTAIEQQQAAHRDELDPFEGEPATDDSPSAVLERTTGG